MFSFYCDVCFNKCHAQRHYYYYYENVLQRSHDKPAYEQKLCDECATYFAKTGIAVKSRCKL